MSIRSCLKLGVQILSRMAQKILPLIPRTRPFFGGIKPDQPSMDLFLEMPLSFMPAPSTILWLEAAGERRLPRTVAEKSTVTILHQMQLISNERDRRLICKKSWWTSATSYNAATTVENKYQLISIQLYLSKRTLPLSDRPDTSAQSTTFDCNKELLPVVGHAIHCFLANPFYH